MKVFCAKPSTYYLFSINFNKPNQTYRKCTMSYQEIFKQKLETYNNENWLDSWSSHPKLIGLVEFACAEFDKAMVAHDKAWNERMSAGIINAGDVFKNLKAEIGHVIEVAIKDVTGQQNGVTGLAASRCVSATVKANNLLDDAINDLYFRKADAKTENAQTEHEPKPMTAQEFAEKYEKPIKLMKKHNRGDVVDEVVNLFYGVFEDIFDPTKTLRNTNSDKELNDDRSQELTLAQANFIVVQAQEILLQTQNELFNRTNREAAKVYVSITSATSALYALFNEIAESTVRLKEKSNSLEPGRKKFLQSKASQFMTIANAIDDISEFDKITFV